MCRGKGDRKVADRHEARAAVPVFVPAALMSLARSKLLWPCNVPMQQAVDVGDHVGICRRAVAARRRAGSAHPSWKSPAENAGKVALSCFQKPCSSLKWPTSTASDAVILWPASSVSMPVLSSARRRARCRAEARSVSALANVLLPQLTGASIFDVTLVARVGRDRHVVEGEQSLQRGVGQP